jgi:hypothetical protein
MLNNNNVCAHEICGKKWHTVLGVWGCSLGARGKHTHKHITGTRLERAINSNVISLKYDVALSAQIINSISLLYITVELWCEKLNSRNNINGNIGTSEFCKFTNIAVFSCMSVNVYSLEGKARVSIGFFFFNSEGNPLQRGIVGVPRGWRGGVPDTVFWGLFP